MDFSGNTEVKTGKNARIKVICVLFNQIRMLFQSRKNNATNYSKNEDVYY